MLRIYRKKNHFVLVINGEPSFLLSEGELALVLIRLGAWPLSASVQAGLGILRLPVWDRGAPLVICDLAGESARRHLHEVRNVGGQVNEQPNRC